MIPSKRVAVLRPLAAIALLTTTIAATPPPAPQAAVTTPPAAASSPAAPAGATGSPAAAGGQEAAAHWPVASADSATQALIDRGVAMMYAFNMGEARVAFTEASKRAPDLAFPYWALAEADTIDINMPTTDEGEKRGAAAIAAGRRHLHAASEEERALIEAAAGRYGRGSNDQKFHRYADALSAYTAKHRDDANVLVVAGFANYTAYDMDKDGAATAKGREVIADADRALAIDPQNLGAHHLRIHVLEDVTRARDAVPDANALDAFRYLPGESHLAHMAGHIWTRLGEYQKLIDDNRVAVANDNDYFASGSGPGREYMRMYHDHDLDFVAYGLTTIGRDDDARSTVEHEDAVMRLKVATRLHDAAAALAIEPKGGGMAAFYHAIADARSGNAAAARAEIARIGKDFDSAKTSPALTAAMAAATHDASAEERILAKAFAEETKPGAGLGDPKARWATPTGEAYGALLLRTHRAAEAERVFTAELECYPNDPHLEWGAAEAQHLQQKDDAVMRALYRSHWQGAHDLTLADLG